MRVYKTCLCGLVFARFIACRGRLCRLCRRGGHVPQQYCTDCRSFTCTGHQQATT